MAESRTVLLYIRRDTRPAFDRLKAHLGREGTPLNHLLCLAIQELARQSDPLRETVRRMAAGWDRVGFSPPSGPENQAERSSVKKS